MRVAVVGAGGIGGFIAAALARSGVDVAVVARGQHLAAIRSDGITVRSELGDFVARVTAGDDLRDLGRFDAVLLTFKAHQWEPLLASLAPLAGTATTIVTLQNGLPFWFSRATALRAVDPGGRIGALFPDQQIVGGVVHASGHIESPGVVVQSGGMRYPLGEAAGVNGERVGALVSMLQTAGLAAEDDPAIRSTIWLKLVNNAGLNPVSALRRLTIAPMLADPQARRHVHALMQEALLVGQAIGVVDRVDLEARIAYASRLADVRTSMLQDAQANRPLELAPISGAIIELAERYGIDVPHTRAIYAQLAGSSV
jgi:2-dehydropantoate 2-reductase